MQTNNIHQIFNLNTESLFNEDEAYRLVNLLIPITAKAKNKINGLNSRLEYFKFQEAEAELIQNQINHEIQRWSEKVRRLGGFPLALYKVKLPAEQGYFIWEHPSAELEFFN